MFSQHPTKFLGPSFLVFFTYRLININTLIYLWINFIFIYESTGIALMHVLSILTPRHWISNQRTDSWERLVFQALEGHNCLLLFHVKLRPCGYPPFSLRNLYSLHRFKRDLRSNVNYIILLSKFLNLTLPLIWQQSFFSIFFYVPLIQNNSCVSCV